ncbi:hypothetical protein [Pontibacter arcticus]|nr:hypothetical protein [Pontibacter arcticus]
MKTLLPKIFLFVFAVVLFASCQQRALCPAYSSISTKATPKSEFVKEQISLGR